jgi:hypothetical protein
VDRRGGAGEVIDLVDLQLDVVCHVVPDKLEIFFALRSLQHAGSYEGGEDHTALSRTCSGVSAHHQMRYIFLSSCKQVVQAENMVATIHLWAQLSDSTERDIVQATPAYYA